MQPQSDGQARRVHERFSIELPVTIVHEGGEFEALSLNLSLGGMFVATDVDLAYGTQATLRVKLPAMKTESEIPVTIRWKTPEGLGLQFGSLRALEVWALNQVVRGG